MQKKFPTKVSTLTKFFLFTLITALFLCAGFADAHAASKKKQKASSAAENKRYAAIVMDVQTGEVLMAKYADSIRHPASLTKIMTLYMVFDAIENGRLRLSDPVSISSHAAKMSPSKLGLPVGATITVENAIKIVVTKSANDIAAALGEKLAGSESNFASRMTHKARELGMARTVYRNASGLPDMQQVTTARDMAKLSMALLRDFPQYYHYFGIKNFEYKGRVHGNHNRLLGQYRGLDGIKTGYTNASGFNLVASAKQNNRRLIGVVFGGTSWKSRNDHMVKLLDEGFAEMSTRGPVLQNASTGAPIPVPPPLPADDPAAALQDIAAASQQSADETDSREDEGAYSPNDSKKISSMIESVQADAYTPPAQSSATSAKVARIASIAATRKPAAPAPKPAANIDPSSYGKKSYDNSTSTAPHSAARTVMQLRIPRSKLPAGIPESQIVRAPRDMNPATASNGGSGSWAIQVGAFQSRAMTDQALRVAQARLPAHLQNAQAIIVPQSTAQGGIVFKGRLQGYTALDAAAACAHLSACLVVSPGS